MSGKARRRRSNLNEEKVVMVKLGATAGTHHRHRGKLVQLSNWLDEAVKIMKEAGSRGAYRRPEPAFISK